MGAQLPARWPGGSERLSSMLDSTMDRLEGAVAGQLQRLLGGDPLRALWLAFFTENLINLNIREILPIGKIPI